MAWKIIDVKVTDGWGKSYLLVVSVNFDDGEMSYNEMVNIPPLGLIERYIFKITMESRIDEAIELCKYKIEENYQSWVEKKYCKSILTKYANGVLGLNHNEMGVKE